MDSGETNATKVKEGARKLPLVRLNQYFCFAMKNKHLTSIQRNQIEVLLQTKTPIKKISQLLDTHQSTIYREIRRNKRRSYSSIYAQQLSNERKERFGRKRKLTFEMKKSIIEKMTQEQWSPKQIAGFSRVNNIPMVSHETIYKLIRQDKKDGGLLWTHTRHRLKHRKRPVGGKQVNIKNKISIDLRPAIVETRKRCGDWEIDTIIGENGKGAILTATERKAGFLLMKKLKHGKQAKELADAAIRMLFAYRNNVHTITSDNGLEFAEHELISRKLKANFYFAHPYSSWERGLNEYTNKLIRQYVIKGSNFDLYDDDFIRLVQNKINRRPREKLNFQTPSKIFYASLI
jgi:IS30 family transposase